MRPRVFPAEDTQVIRNMSAGLTSFNEAAGIPRGRRAASPLVQFWGPRASMRPRVFPAEDGAQRSSSESTASLQ